MGRLRVPLVNFRGPSTQGPSWRGGRRQTPPPGAKVLPSINTPRRAPLSPTSWPGASRPARRGSPARAGVRVLAAEVDGRAVRRGVGRSGRCGRIIARSSSSLTSSSRSRSPGARVMLVGQISTSSSVGSPGGSGLAVVWVPRAVRLGARRIESRGATPAATPSPSASVRPAGRSPGSAHRRRRGAAAGRGRRGPPARLEIHSRSATGPVISSGSVAGRGVEARRVGDVVASSLGRPVEPAPSPR